jgi:hypothetical protein
MRTCGTQLMLLRHWLLHQVFLLSVDLAYATKLCNAIIRFVKLRKTVSGTNRGCLNYLLKYLKYL